MKRALLVNDSLFESLILKDLLTQLNYEVEMADEYDALYQVEQFEPELIVVNYIMHEIRGDQLIEQIKEENPNLICLLSSSSIIHKDAVKENILDGVLRTPVSMFTLKDLLRRIDVRISKTIIEKKKKEIDGEERFCDHCNADISAFSLHIVFCPFCGEEL